MDAMGFLLGIDYGTGGCKVTALRSDGSLAGEASTEFATYHDHPGWSEQDPSDWWKALAATLAKLSAKGIDLKAVSACALDGSTHNAVLLDDCHRPLRRTIMWTDQRATAECELLKARCGEMVFSTCYQTPAPTWTLPQLMWLHAHEPDVIARTRHVLFVKDYVRLLLTGEAATDYIEAQGTLMWAMPKAPGERGAWSPELVALSGLEMSAMPRIISPADVAGRVRREAAAFTGLPEGIPVVCGSSDSAVEDYGAGAVEVGDLVIKLATAGNVNSMTGEAHPHPKTLTYSHIVPGMWYSVSATNAAALSMRWFRDTFFAGAGGDAYAIIDGEASASSVGANGVLFHPYLQGERCPYWDPDLRASFTGVSISSTRGDFARAVMEGVAMSLRDCYRTLEEMSLPVKRIFLIGGGARSSLWREIVANVFNRRVLVPSPGDASFGAALLAGVGTGVFTGFREAVEKCLRVDCTIEPSKGAAAVYESLFAHYRQVHDVLAPIKHS